MQNLKVIENELAPAYEASPNLKWYRERIVEMVGQIEEQRFLKAIYISLNDYICEYNF